MSDDKTPCISTRKSPRQQRSARLVEAILQAATQVLAREGMRRFTTARVAEAAGVSIGSLYQYFPNKAALLFALQSDEWRQTGTLLNAILHDEKLTPEQRLRTLVLAFLRSEFEEAEMRSALEDAAPFYRDAPEAQQIKQQQQEMLTLFAVQVLPEVAEEEREPAGELIWTTLHEAGKRLSQNATSVEALEQQATRLADMFCAYVASLKSPADCR